MVVSIDERPSPPPAAVDTPVRPGSREEVTELESWEDEGGATSSHRPEFPRQHARRHFDEFQG